MAAEFGKRMGLARFVSHQLDDSQNPCVRLGSQSDPEPFADRASDLLRREATVCNVGEQLDGGLLIDQIERSTRSYFAHPRAKLSEVLSERIDVEKGHAAGIAPQVMQAVRQDQHAT